MATIQRRVLKSGEIRYRAEIRIQGHPRRVRVFPKRSLAKEWAQQTEAEIRRGQATRVDGMHRTFGELLATYVERELPSLRQETYRRNRLMQLRFWRDHLGASTRIDEIRRGHIVNGLWKLEKGDGPSGRRASTATRNRYLASIRRLFSYAVELDWLERNPAKGGLQAKEPRGRVRFLSDEERDRLLAVVADDPELELFVLLAISTGARLGEIKGLHWDAIDFDRQQALLHQTKNGERRVLPLHGQALERLVRYRDEHRGRSPFVFGGVNGRPMFPRSRWTAALKAAEIEDFRFHDLRHTAASYLAMNGATPAELADVLGHKTLQMVKRYTHFAEAHTHDLVRRMNERMLGGAS